MSAYEAYEDKVKPLEEALALDMHLKIQTSTERHVKLEVLNATKKV